jgi:predicted transcriptional regulator
MRTTLLFVGDDEGLRDVDQMQTRVGKRVKNAAPPDPAFGKMIRERRLALDIQQVEFAKLCGVHQVTMSRYETATTSVPRERRTRIENILRRLELKQ